MSERRRLPRRRGLPRPSYLQISALLFLLLTVTSWAFIFLVDGARLRDVFSAESAARARTFVARLAGAGADPPAYAEPGRWREALRLGRETLAMSVLAIGLAGTGALLTVLPSARIAADGSLTLSRTRPARIFNWLARGLHTVSRAVPELVFGMLVILFLSPGTLAGAVALGLHNFGVLGKLWAEVVEDLDLRPVRGVRSAGAGLLQTLAYAVLPMALPQFLTYLFYRWEVIIRTTVVVGFVSASGLGREFRLAMSWLHYTHVTLLLFCYLVLVLAVDLVSGMLRRLAR